MTPKKYSERKREENERATSESLGVIMILISSFLLLCVLTRTLILGEVGEAVFNILVGFFGYTAYPLLLLCFVFGIVKAKKREVSFPRRYVIATIVCAVCVILIAHLATSSAYVGYDYAGYLAEVYASKATVGGLFVGLVAYPVYAIFGFVVSYIFYALVILGAILLSTSAFNKKIVNPFAKKTTKSKTKSRVDAFAPTRAYDENGDYPSTAQNGLFVGTIIPPTPTYRTDERGFDDIEQSSRDDERPMSVEESEKIYEKERARKILFGERKFDLSSYLPRTETTEPTISDRKKTDGNNDAPSVALPADKPFEHRFIAGDIINGDELSAQIRSSIDPLRQGAKSEQTSSEVVSESEVELENSADVTPQSSVATALPFVNPSPIINGDYYQEDLPAVLPEPEMPVESEEIVAEQTSSEVVDRDTYSYTVEYANGDEPIEEKEEIEYRVEYAGSTEETLDDVVESDFIDDQSGNIEIEDETIVYSSEDEESNDDSFTEIIPQDDEPIIFEDSIDLPEDDVLDGQIAYDGEEEIPTESETQSEEDLSKKFEESTTSFKIIDEVEDASERGYDNPDDMTGYYGHVDAPVSQVKPAPPKVEPPVDEQPATSSYADSKVEEKPTSKISSFDDRISAVSKKVDGEKSQIDMDTFMKTSAEKKTAETKPKKVKKVKYVRPPVDLLTTESETPHQNEEEMSAKIALLEESLEALGVPAKVDSVTISPAITRYELSMPTGVSVNRIENLSKDIGYYLASNGAIRIESPIPGKRAVGVEVPNDHIYTVSLTEIIKSKEFREAKSSLSFALGKDLNGKIRVESLEKMPHLLVAGATKSGKSSGLNSMLISLMYKSSPSEVKFILIDPKLVEFTAYNGIPHLMTPQAITDVNEAINAFKWTEKEMDRRYLILQKSAVRDIQEYNQRQEILDGLEPKMPYIVVIVDEFASLMLSTKEHAKELDEIIMNIAGKARAAGIHLVLATQRPSVNVITGTVKANLNSRIAFAVASSQDSRIILDNNGAESLLGRGDMLFAPVDSPVEIRVQGAYVDNSEVKRVVQFVKENNPSEYDEEFIAALKVKSGGGGGVDGVEPIEHNLLKDVCRCLIKSGSASGSLITRRFSVGWNKAAKIMEYVESLGFVGPQVGAKGRELIITKEKFEEYFGEPFDNN